MAKNDGLGMLIIVDTREQTPWRFSQEATVQRAKLDAGDYSLGGFTDRVAIERKSLADAVQTFCSSERERFEDECRLLRGYEWKAIVIEANVDDVLAHAYRSQAHPNSVIGSTVAWWADYGIPTLWAGDARNATNIVERLFKRLWLKCDERAA
jgi:ERCC4-type nuclease